MNELQRLQSDHVRLLDFYYQVINSMRGTPAVDARLVGCEHLALKIFLHSASILYLSSGTNLTLSSFPGGAHVIDFPSIIVISRALLETYLTQYEIFFEQLSEDEFEYRYAVFQVKGFKLREDPRFIPFDADFSLAQEVQKGFHELNDARNRMMSTAHFASLNEDQKKSSLGGALFPRRSLVKRVQVAGLGGGAIVEAIYAAHSSYVHTDATSAMQIVSAGTDTLRAEHLEQPLRLAIVVMALVIANYYKKFVPAQAVCDSNPALFSLVRTIEKTASQMK